MHQASVIVGAWDCVSTWRQLAAEIDDIWGLRSPVHLSDVYNFNYIPADTLFLSRKVRGNSEAVTTMLEHAAPQQLDHAVAKHAPECNSMHVHHIRVNAMMLQMWVLSTCGSSGRHACGLGAVSVEVAGPPYPGHTTMLAGEQGAV